MMDDNENIFGDITQTPGSPGYESDPHREYMEASYLDESLPARRYSPSRRSSYSSGESSDVAIDIMCGIFLFGCFVCMLWYVLESWFGPFRWWPW